MLRSLLFCLINLRIDLVFAVIVVVICTIVTELYTLL
jgi:hypothetical protein